ncbi:hypothetical protein [Piscinibacter sp.]|jgi:hypothetical protein|uniref:hypothetical protein n=1 Tax=Piscinibacter sp. TaxID=1903157 RepID=UPI00355A4C83
MSIMVCALAVHDAPGRRNGTAAHGVRAGGAGMGWVGRAIKAAALRGKSVACDRQVEHSAIQTDEVREP